MQLSRAITLQISWVKPGIPRREGEGRRDGWEGGTDGRMGGRDGFDGYYEVGAYGWNGCIIGNPNKAALQASIYIFNMLFRIIDNKFRVFCNLV